MIWFIRLKNIMFQIKLFIFCSVLLVIVGCSPPGTLSKKGSDAAPDDLNKYTHVVTFETNYYLSGPQQAMPPEGKLKAGTKIVIIQDAGSYSLVKSEEGVQAYISSGSFQPVKASPSK